MMIYGFDGHIMADGVLIVLIPGDIAKAFGGLMSLW